MINKTPDDISNLVKGLILPAALTTLIKEDVKKHYYLGIDYIEKIINANILDINPEVIQSLEKNTFNLIKDMNEEVGNKLRVILEQNIINNQSNTKIVGEVKKLFNTTEFRARTIARTETARAYNIGALEAARKSPIKMVKYYSAVLDSRTSKLCRRLAYKYNKKHPIPLNQYFVDDVTGKSFLTPPGGKGLNGSHPNCRSEALFIPAQI